MFRAGRAVGDLIPERAGADWRFEAGFLERIDESRVQVLAHGFRIVPTQRDSGEDMVVVFVEPGVMVGTSRIPCRPNLLSAGGDAQRLDDLVLIQTGHSPVALAYATDPDGTVRFSLVSHGPNAEDAQFAAREHLKDHVRGLFESACEQRTVAPRPTDDDPSSASCFAFAREMLAARLRPPGDRWSNRWSFSGDFESQTADLNELMLLTLAWQRLDPKVAQDLVLSALNTVEPDGSFFRRFNSMGPTAPVQAAWPFLAQAVRRVWDTAPSEELLHEAVSVLPLYLDWALRYFDPEGHGHPCWPTAGEAWIPDTWDDALASVDLTAFLLAEIDAVQYLFDEAEDLGPASETFRAKHHQLAEALQHFFWDASQKAYRDRYRDGDFIRRPTVSGLAPLLWEGLPDSYAAQLIEGIEAHRGVAQAEGFLLWAQWPDDPDEPPRPAAHQALLLDALLRRRGAEGFLRQQAPMREAFLRRQAQPSDPAALPADAEAANAGSYLKKWHPREVSAADAALAVMLLLDPTASAPGNAPPHRLIGWANRHPLAIPLATVALIVSTVGGIALLFEHNNRMTGASVETLFGQGLGYHRRGEQAEAIRIYQELLAKENMPEAQLQFHMGNAYFRQKSFQEAEACFRKAMEDSTLVPIAPFNLIMSIYHGGRVEEARQLFVQFIELYDEAYPDTTARARRAIKLIDHHLAAQAVAP